MAPLSTMMKYRDQEGSATSSSNDQQLMVPLTSSDSWGCLHDNNTSNGDLETLDNGKDIGNDLAANNELDQSTIHTVATNTQENDGADTTEDYDDDDEEEDSEDSSDDDSEEEEDIPFWQRVPPALAMAFGLFIASLLTCLGTVYQYKAGLHGHVYAFFFTLAKTAIMVLSAYVIGQTFWYTQQDLDQSIQRQERMHTLLASVYPEHVLQRLLEDLEHDEENQNQCHDEEQTETEQSQQAQEAQPQEAGVNAEEQWVNKLKKQHSAANLEGMQSDPDLQQQEQPQQQQSRQNSVSTLASLGGISNLGLNLGEDDQEAPASDPKNSKTQGMDQSQQEHPSDHPPENPLLGTGSGRNHHHSTVTKSVTDLYPNTTVFYSQIVGFTAWSSQRAPNQVFELLETIFCEFDEVANRGGIFKVESIADSYIAVTGIPETDPDHAVRMAQFASDCLACFAAVTELLERSLGPDTGELQLRIGLHSGPVIAGVLKGERSRFQLFGNTVNNAVIIEREGKGNHIHVSRETAELIRESGKAHWVVPRDASEAGMTFWLAAAKGHERRASCSTAPLSPSVCSESSSVSSASEKVVDIESDDETSPSCNNLSDDDMSVMTFDTGFTFTSSISTSQTTSGDPTRKKAWTMQDILTAKEQRLIEWTVDQLALMLKKIVARRNAIHRYEERLGLIAETSDSATPPILHYSPNNGMVLDEVQEMVMIPRYNDALLREDALHDASSVELGERVIEELTNYVSTVTTFYYDPSRNPFHNFMHASHVLMSVVKMMQRIVSPSQASLEKMKAERMKDEKQGRGRWRRKSPRRQLSMEELHDHTYGITTDPLTQFAVVFAALIHDLDHPGVPNATLAQEKTRLARIYNNRSISEQNSLDMGWDLLMDPSYQNLVRTICSNLDELKRFRQLLVQTVMATDIADAELRTARNQRWDKAFAVKAPTPMTDGSGESAGEEEESDADRNRKATIVLEHLLQASDIAHTMQHWEVFKKWNEKLFREMYLAYLHGRSDKDPGDFWYNGEIGFFKFYIIPLAKKLSECGVFGVSSDEYLNYAQNNLQIWETKGVAVVEQFREAALRDYGTRDDRPASPSN